MVPTTVPKPTDFPTKGGDFVYQQWGDTNFGHHYQDLYYWAHQHAIRRPGWSWNEPLAGYGPFCYGDNCYSVQSACEQMGGVLLSESYCSFPEDVKIAGPSCWEGDCTATGGEVCASIGGITVGDTNVQWCLFKGDRTIFGPACYNGWVDRVENLYENVDLGNLITFVPRRLTENAMKTNSKKLVTVSMVRSGTKTIVLFQTITLWLVLFVGDQLVSPVQ